MWLPRLVITVGSVAAIAAFALAFRLADTAPEKGEQLDLSVEAVFPTQGSLEPRQTQVFIDLAPNWALDQLVIEGTRIEDRFINDSGSPLGQYFFEPGEGTPFPIFEPGRIEVIALIVNELEPTEQRTVAWSFTAS